MSSKKCLLLIIIVIFIIIICAKGYMFSKKYTQDEVKKEYIVFVESLKEITDKKVSYYVKLKKGNNGKYAFCDKFILNIYEDYNSEKTDLTEYAKYSYGDVIELEGKIVIPELLNNPGEFNYKRYLYSKNIYGIISSYCVLNKVDYTLNVKEKIMQKINELKVYVSNLIQDSMNLKNAEVTKSMLYGEKKALDIETKENFKEAGVSHLLTVSGANVATLIYILTIIMDRFKCKKWLKKIILLVYIILFILIAGSELSILRAGIMAIILIITGLKSKRKTYILLFIALGIILLLSPFALFNTGFQLSLLATLGIASFLPLLNKFTKNKIKEKIHNIILRKIVKYIVESACITLSVQLLILPIELSVFNMLPIGLITSNILCNIFSVPIRMFGTIGILFSFLPNVSKIIFSCLQLIVILLVKVIDVTKNISFVLTTPTMPLYLHVIYYVWIFLLFLKLKLILTNNKNIPEGYYKKTIKKINLLKNITMVICIVIVLAISTYSKYFSSFVYFFNVGQGEMSYIKNGEESIIVDMGSLTENLAFNVIDNYFKSENTNKIDLLIISHMHADHINGINEFIQKYNVGEIMYANPVCESEEYEELIKNIKEKNINTKIVNSGDKIELNNIQIEILLPDIKNIINNDAINANSLVCIIKAKNTNMLYMGDATKETEERLINKKIEKVDIYKVGHHGSKSSTSAKLLQKVQPNYAVISAKKKIYGHPSKEVLELLKENKILTCITENGGAIKFRIQ